MRRPRTFWQVLFISLVGVVFNAGAEGSGQWARRNVAIVIYEGVELLDFSGPGEAFASADEGAFRVFTVAPTRQPILSQGFVKVTPDYSIEDAPMPDIVVLPGGNVDAFMKNAQAMSWLSRVTGHTELALSVCNGAFILASTGLLDGKTATTHWGAIPQLRKRFPKIDVRENTRFVDNGKVMTTAGVSAGIDGALHVIQRLLGDDVAWNTARYMQYDFWEPNESPTLSHDAKEALRALVFRDAARAEHMLGTLVSANSSDAVKIGWLGRAQALRGAGDKALVNLERAVALGDRRPNTLSALAEAQIAKGNNATAAATLETLLIERDSPLVAYNLACLRARLGDNEAALSALARAVSLGFTYRQMALDDEDLRGLRADPRFLKVLSGTPSGVTGTL